MTVISLPSRSDFDAVFKSPDAKASNRDFLVLAKHREHAVSHRIGFVASKKKIPRERAGQGRTVITIAHRLSTVANADRIIVLEKGVVVETGTHAELLERNGRYLDLWTLQRSEQAA